MDFKILLLCPAITLSACGGSSTNSNVLAISADGFASAETSEIENFDFTFRDLSRVVGDSDGNVSFEKQTIRLIGNSNGPTQITLDGIVYDLTEDLNDPGEFVFRDGEDRILVEAFLNTGTTAAVEIFSVIGDELNRGAAALGYDTNPSFIDKETGTAQYRGDILATLTNDFDGAFADGTFVLDVDFDGRKISGIASIFDAGIAESDFAVPTIGLELVETDVTGNGFAGDIVVTSGDIDGTLITGTYDGRFFGDQAEDIGGQMIGQIDVNDVDSDTFVEGAFVGSKPDT